MADGFTFEIDVRYLEVDQQGVVFNAWYLAYFDEAMTALLAHHGATYDQIKAEGYDVMLVHSEIDWRSGLRWGERAAVDVACARLGRTSIALDFIVRRGQEVVAQAQTVYAVIGEDGRAAALPDSLRKAVGPVAPLREERRR